MIMAIAERVNYIPNSLARGLVSQKSDTLGIILPKIFFLQGPFFSQVLSGVEHVSVDNGYNILIASATGKVRDKQFPFNLTRARRIDGMLIINEYQRISNLPALKDERFPFVFVNRYIKDPTVNCVASDNVEGGRLATSHLIGLGHTRIGIATGGFNLAPTHARLAGYRRALEENNIPFDESLVQEGLFEKGIETGLVCGEKLLSMQSPPSAIFAFSDELAIGVMQAARNRGLRMPDDLAVVGYDNISYSAHLNPPLTTISQNAFAIGQTACQLLLDKLSGKKVENNNILIPVELVVRESCGSRRDKAGAA
jgi:DNA-binding LacI/PurR family transcriptional regulator